MTPEQHAITRREGGTMDIKIESGIPAPIKRRSNRYPFREMQIGDSFALNISDASRAALYMAAKRAGVKITTRAFHDGRRVWRIA